MSILTPALDFFGIGPSRNFAGLSGYCTINENTTDALEVTQQPIQTGSSIADHAYKKPISLTLQIQFATGSGSLLSAVGFGGIGAAIGGALPGVGSALGLGQSLKQIYQSLIELQSPTPPAVITPFTVSTLKRSYPNMLLVTLGLVTDNKTENVLAITAGFQEAIIVSTGTTIVSASLLKNVASNLATAAAGTKSAAKTIVDGIGAAFK